MPRTFGLILAFAFIASPAFADIRCNEPYAPEIHATASTTNKEIVNMRDDTQTFIAASDLYQACLLKVAEKNSSFAAQAKKLIDMNQREKTRIGNAYNALLATHNEPQRKNVKTSDASN